MIKPNESKYRFSDVNEDGRIEYTITVEYEEEIETKEDAYYWLQSKLSEYGNTYHFPQEERIKLDRLIDRFGNTYFWER